MGDLPTILTCTALAATAWALLWQAWREVDALEEQDRAEQARVALAEHERRLKLRVLAAQFAAVQAKIETARSDRTRRRYEAKLKAVRHDMMRTAA